MSYLCILRQLLDQLQFERLRDNTEAYLTETNDPQALPLKVLAHLHLGERAQAQMTLKEAMAQRDALDTDACVDLAAVYGQLWQLEEAVALLKPVLAANPDHPLALARLAWCRMQQGELETAQTLYTRSAQLMPQRLPVWIALVRLALLQEQTTAAQQALDRAIEQLGQCHQQMPDAAVTAFTAQFRGQQLEIWVAADQLAEAEQWLDNKRDSMDEETWVDLITSFANLVSGVDRHALAEEALRNALKHCPQNLSLISQLAELAQLQGRTAQTIHLLRRALALAKKAGKPEVGLLARLSAAQLQQNPEAARKTGEKAVALAELMQASEETPEGLIAQLKMQAKNALAQVESQEQNYDVAETLFNELLAINPWFLPALQGLGQQQMQRGRLDEAVMLFERIKQIDPVKGYSSLINARRFPDDEETLARMEKAARQPSLEGSVRAGILFQLASAWEKRKDYDKAMALAHDANRGSRPHLHYDPKAHRQRCARIRHAFPKALYEHRKACGYRGEDESLPVFVLGMPRSGTTLVEQILASHSQIFGAGELGLIPQRIAGLNRWERHVSSGRSYPDCIDDLNSYVTEGIAKGMLQELRAMAADDKPDAKFVVDKLPHNFENIGFIKFLFPKAKIISVRRDPRDIALSNYFTDYAAKHGGMGFAYDLEWMGQQLADHNLLLHHWNDLFPGEILQVQYENVVEDTEVEARRMLDYIGVDFEPQVLAFNELDRPVKTASVWQVRQPIYKTSKAKWLRYQHHLAELIKGTNANITWEPIEDMVTLPTPGLLTDGVALYKADKLDDAEYAFKKLLHHLPEHAAANHMLGVIYARKGHVSEAVELMEKALEKCPWNKHWRQDLIQASELLGDTQRAQALKQPRRRGSRTEDANAETWGDEKMPDEVLALLSSTALNY